MATTYLYPHLLEVISAYPMIQSLHNHCRGHCQWYLCQCRCVVSGGLTCDLVWQSTMRIKFMLIIVVNITIHLEALKTHITTATAAVSEGHLCTAMRIDKSSRAILTTTVTATLSSVPATPFTSSSSIRTRILRARVRCLEVSV
jgi:hypothetical protein